MCIRDRSLNSMKTSMAIAAAEPTNVRIPIPAPYSAPAVEAKITQSAAMIPSMPPGKMTSKKTRMKAATRRPMMILIKRWRIIDGGRKSSLASQARCLLVGHYNKAEIDGLLDTDGTALIYGAEGATRIIAMAVDLDTPAGEEIGDGSACATGGGKAGLAFSTEGLAIAASSLGEDKLALYPRSVKKRESKNAPATAIERPKTRLTIGSASKSGETVMGSPGQMSSIAQSRDPKIKARPLRAKMRVPGKKKSSASTKMIPRAKKRMTSLPARPAMC